MLRPLKFLVIFMGILILVGVTLLAVKLGGGLSGGISKTGGESFGIVELGLPAGTTIDTVQSSDNRLILKARLPGGGERLIILDMDTGAVLGTVNVTAKP